MATGKLQRLWRHLCTGMRTARRAFPLAVLESIEQAVKRAEGRHGGQIRFVVEASLEADELWAGITPRERAIEVFARLRIWDTEHNDGVLIYVLLADHDVEIVADRGIAARVPPGEWEAVCKRMERQFAAGHFRDGALEGIEGVSEILERHAPEPLPGRNDLPDAPMVLP